MRNILLFMTFLALVCFSPTVSFADDKNKTFNAETFTLKNGMQVVVVPNHRAPVVTHMVWYKVGAADESPGLSGMAHYLEHLMFKGTEKLAPGDFSKTVKTLGGRDNAFTGQDFTAYFQSIATEHLETVMRMEADRMLNLNPPTDHYKSEKNVVIEERRQRTENDPRGLFSEQMQSALFVNHPYGTPVIGWMKEIEGYEWPDVKTFYDTWYAPNNAFVIVSGDITAEQFKPLAEKIYGNLPTKDVPVRKRPDVPPAIGETDMTLHHDRIRQPQWQAVLLAPGYTQNKQDALVLQVFEEILSGGPTTRLYKSLVVDKKRATAVSFSYRPTALDYGSLWISATPSETSEPDDVKELVWDEIQNVIDNGVTEQEVKDAIQRMQDSAVFARDSLSGPPKIIGYALATGSTLDDIEYWPDNIASVTAQQVQDAAKKYLSRDNPWIRPPVNGYLLPKEVSPQKSEKEEDKP